MPARSIHGMVDTPEYISWYCMKARCNNPNRAEYPDYGGRGIAVCQRWTDSFLAFLEDMGPRPSPEHTLDRWPNKDGNYEPGNCRWATRIEQARNQRSNHLIIYMGRLMTLAEISEVTGVNRETISYRLEQGESVEDAVRQPIAQYTVDGKSMTLKEWAEFLGIPYRTLYSRITRYGWSPERALKKS